MKKIASKGVLLAAFIVGLASCNQKSEPVEQAQEVNEQVFEDTPQEETKDDLSEFMTEAASGGMMEVELGQLRRKKPRMPTSRTLLR